jgi:endonuclease/exonuclease/phosphatase family metal-dependent hydrolase
VHLRALTYNIRSGTDIFGRARLAAQGAVLRDSGADVVMLQEVWPADQAEQLAALAGLPYVVFNASRRAGDGEFGNAILSRWPLEDVVCRPVPAGRRGQPRWVVSALLPSDHTPWLVMCAHFGLFPGEMEPAARIVVELADAHRGPVVFGGDLNRPLASARGHRRLHAALSDAAALAKSAAPTFPSPWPVLRLDYLYVRDVRVCGARVLSTTASDHRPLLAELESG